MVRGYTVHIGYIHAALKALQCALHFGHTVCTVKNTAKTITGSMILKILNILCYERNFKDNPITE